MRRLEEEMVMAQRLISFEPKRMLAKGLGHDNEHNGYKFPSNHKSRKVLALPTNCGRNASHKNSPSLTWAQRHRNWHSVRDSPSKFKGRKLNSYRDFPKNYGQGKLVACRKVNTDLAHGKSSLVCDGTNAAKRRMFNDVDPDNHHISNSMISEHGIAAHMHPMKTHVREGIKNKKWLSDIQMEKRVDRVGISKGLNSYGHTSSTERKKTTSMLEDMLSGSKMGTIMNRRAQVCNRSHNLINLRIVMHDHPEAVKVRETRKLYNTMLKNRGGRGNMEVLEQLIMQKKRVIPKMQFGHIPGIDIGDKFYYRSELIVVGLHGQRESGIDYVVLGGIKYATSIVDSGRYMNENKPGDVLIYSGQGGYSKIGGKTSDQKLERGNLALANSKRMGYPVRVIYKSKSTLKSTNMRKDNIEYVYDGLYEIKDYWEDEGDQNHKMVFKFKLQRLPHQPRS